MCTIRTHTDTDADADTPTHRDTETQTDRDREAMQTDTDRNSETGCQCGRRQSVEVDEVSPVDSDADDGLPAAGLRQRCRRWRHRRRRAAVADGKDTD